MTTKPPPCENPDHKSMRLKLWCDNKNCKRGICVLCATDHTGHVLIQPEDVKEVQSYKIQKIRDRIQQLYEIQNESKEKLATQAQEVLEYKEQKFQELQENIENLKTYLDELQSQLTTQFDDSFFNPYNETVEELNKLFETHEGKLSKAMETIDDLVNSDKSDVEKVYSYIHDKLEEKMKLVIDDQANKVEYLQAQIEKYKPSFPKFELVDIKIEKLGQMFMSNLTSAEYLQNLKTKYPVSQPLAVPPQLVISRVQWDANRSGKQMDLSNENQVAAKRKSYNGWASCLTNCNVTNGEIYIEVLFDNAGKGGFADIYTGIIKNEAKINFEDECLNGYGSCTVWALNRNGDFYEPQKGCITENKEQRKFDTGDIISIHINGRKKQATFSVNSLECLKIDNIASNVVPYVCLGGTNQVVSIHNFYISKS